MVLQQLPDNYNYLRKTRAQVLLSQEGGSGGDSLSNAGKAGELTSLSWRSKELAAAALTVAVAAVAAAVIATMTTTAVELARAV